MKFNRNKFIEETSGSLESAMNCIDNLIEMIAFYTENDEDSEMNGCCCFGKQAEFNLLTMAENRKLEIFEYLESYE